MTRQNELLRRSVVSELEDYLKKKFHKSTVLHLFGSSVNGFGTNSSDLDICLSCSPNLQKRRLIRTVANKLRSIDSIEKLWSRPRTRVPIISFIHKPSQFEVELSINNHWPLHNSDLLRRYSAVDERCRVLVHLMKHVAKQSCIIGPQHQFISSYAYTLMVVHYLQHTHPPVLPVLQQLQRPHNAGEPPHTLDGCSTYFYKRSNQHLRSAWPDLHTNEQSCGELWKGMLSFYTDGGGRVVSIRRISPPHSKMDRLQIEDPFETHRDLGSNLTPHTMHRIQQVLQYALDQCGGITPQLCENNNWSPSLFCPP
uniref:Poly(A) RNA polymerase mitochondrial-like central palm domain-containing protein n=1 Tax=Ciona savignyi TaxID=51511 RepID=H2ZK19_CIOSA